MKKLLTVFALLTFFTVAHGKDKEGVLYDVELTRVKDGDTVAFKATWLPDPLPKELAVRVYGVDTPEKGFRAKCPQEDAKGQAATKFTTAAVNASTKRQVYLMG